MMCLSLTKLSPATLQPQPVRYFHWAKTRGISWELESDHSHGFTWVFRYPGGSQALWTHVYPHPTKEQCLVFFRIHFEILSFAVCERML